jgi:hypothetical protein
MGRGWCEALAIGCANFLAVPAKPRQQQIDPLFWFTLLDARTGVVSELTGSQTRTSSSRHTGSSACADDDAEFWEPSKLAKVEFRGALQKNQMPSRIRERRLPMERLMT